MDAQNHGHELPAPSRGGVDIYDPSNYQEISKSKELNQPVSPEKELQSMQPSKSQPVDDPSSQTPTATNVNNNNPQTTSVTSSASNTTAGEVDVIEKVWVEIAKNVIQSTRSNPSEQSAQLARVKSEYLKNRFNKEIKTPEEKK